MTTNHYLGEAVQTAFEFHNGEGDSQPVCLRGDICRNRHKDAETSVEANIRANPTKHLWRLKVLGVITQLKTATLKDVCERLGRPENALSGRVSELKADGVIEVCGRRGGFSVYRIK